MEGSIAAAGGGLSVSAAVGTGGGVILLGVVYGESLESKSGICDLLSGCMENALSQNPEYANLLWTGMEKASSQNPGFANLLRSGI